MQLIFDLLIEAHIHTTTSHFSVSSWSRQDATIQEKTNQTQRRGRQIFVVPWTLCLMCVSSTSTAERGATTPLGCTGWCPACSRGDAGEVRSAFSKSPSRFGSFTQTSSVGTGLNNLFLRLAYSGSSVPLRVAAVQQVWRKTAASAWCCWRWILCLATLFHQNHLRANAEGRDTLRRLPRQLSTTQWGAASAGVVVACCLMMMGGIVILQGRGRPNQKSRSRTRPSST